MPKTQFEQELTELVNKHSRENASSTPDFVLARFMVTCLEAYEQTHNRCLEWYSIEGMTTPEYPGD